MDACLESRGSGRCMIEYWVLGDVCSNFGVLGDVCLEFGVRGDAWMWA